MQLRFLVALFVTMTATAAPRTISATGNWDDTATWGGAAKPGDGDNVLCGGNFTVTVNTPNIVGEGNPSNYAMDLGVNCDIVIADGGKLQVRGHVKYTTGPSNFKRLVLVEAGGEWQWDSSTSAPPTVQYAINNTDHFQFRAFEVMGSAVKVAKYNSHPSGNMGFIWMNGFAYGGTFRANFALIERIAGFEWFYNNSNVEWNVQNSIFDTCGKARGLNIATDSTYVHEGNIHKNTIDGEVLGWSTTGPRGTGRRDVKWNVFDKIPWNVVSSEDFSLYNNFLGGHFGFLQSGTEKTALFERNIVLSAGGTILFSGDVKDLFLYNDGAINNPHVTANNKNFPATIRDIIFGQFGPVTDDPGEFMQAIGCSGSHQMNLWNSIFLPTSNSTSATNMWSATVGTEPCKFAFEHNTFFGGYFNAGAGQANGVQLSENAGYFASAGIVPLFRSNLFWGDGVHGYVKYHDLKNSASTADTCGVCDYNGSFNATEPVPGISPYPTNATKSYVATFSTAPGAHDVDGQNPNFYDKANVYETFAIKWYRPKKGLPTPPTWASGSTYAIGDVVSNSVAGVYWGTPISYRYVNGSGCSSGNPEPGSGTFATWRACWEFETTHVLRDSTGNKETFIDMPLGLFGDSAIYALLQFVRFGYRPTNPIFIGAAADLGDIGAVPVAFPPTGGGGPGPGPSSGVSVRIGGGGAAAKKGTVKK